MFNVPGLSVNSIISNIVVQDMISKGEKLKPLICDTKIVPGYFVRKNGDIFSSHSGSFVLLEPSYSRTKHSTYPCLNIKIDGKRKTRYVHRLVCETFNPVPLPSFLSAEEWKVVEDNLPKNIRQKLFSELVHPKHFQVNHIDHDTTNYHSSNLEWVLGHENLAKYAEFSKNVKLNSSVICA